MGCVQSYFKRAQTSLSPSSTHDSERKALDDGSPIHEITRQPISSIREESEDHGDGYQDGDGNNNTQSGEKKNSLHCVGVEATAIRQLAASTGTVAILGTTAKVDMKKSASGNIIEEEPTENGDVVEVVIEHNNIIPSNSGPLHQTIEAIAKEVRTDLINNGFHKQIPDTITEVNNTTTLSNDTTLNNNSVSIDQRIVKVEKEEAEQRTVQNDMNSNLHINSELTNNVSKDISISRQTINIDNVNIAPSNLDNQILNSKEIVTNLIESKISESNIENYDSIDKGPSLEAQFISGEIKNDKVDQINSNVNIELRTNNNSTLDKQTKVPLAKHFKQEVNTSEVITKLKSKSSKESSLEREITNKSVDIDQSVDSNKTGITHISKTSSVETNSDKGIAHQCEIVSIVPLSKLPSIDNKTVSETVDEIIQSATNIVLEKSKAKLIEKSPTEPEIFDNESKKSMSHDLDTDSNEASDRTVISQESLNEEHVREGVTSVLISKNTTNKSIDNDEENDSDSQENDVIFSGELKEKMKEEILPDLNGIIKAAEEHVNAFKEQLDKIVENGVPDEDSLRSKNSFDKEEMSIKDSTEKDDDVFDSESMQKPTVSEEKLPANLETLPKKIMMKGLSLSLTSQTDESSIEISPENDVSNTVSDTSEATKDIFTPHSGNSMRTPQYDGTPLSEEKTPRIDFPLSDSMIDDLKREVDEICDEAVARINTATTKIQAGYRGYKMRKSLKQTNTEGGAQESFDGSDLPPPDLERLGSIHEDDMTRPLEEVPDFDTDSEYPLPPPSDSLSESLSSAATKIQAGVRGYLTRKQVKQGSSTTVPSDSDFSETSVTSQDLIRTSTEMETQVQRLPESGKHFRGVELPDTGKHFRGGKRMSLDSNMKDTRPFRPPLRSVVSERDDGEEDDPQEIWRILTQEADKAAVLIQSSFRGYQARKKLSRGDAVHMPTTSSSATPSSARSEEPVTISHRGTGEFHDAVFGTPTHDFSTNPTIMVSATRNTITDENEAAAKIQAGFRGYKTRKELKDTSNSNQTCSTSSSSEPLSLEDKSAAKIQAGVRGYLVRKRKQEEKKAATKIQAGFRGYKTRKDLKSPGSDENRSLC